MMFNFWHFHIVMKSVYHLVRLSVHMYQHGSHWVDFCKNVDIEGFYKNLSRKSKFGENWTTRSGTLCVTATGNNKMQ